MANLFARKPLDKLMHEAEDVGEHSLKRSLGPVNLIALGIGGIIGAGLFVRTAAAIADRAGPSVVIAFILAGVGCAFAGLCYAEFASMIPVAGSAYTYSYATMGELVAWIIGWDLILEYAVSVAGVAVGWGQYFNDLLDSLFGISLPEALAGPPGEGGSFNLPAVFIVLAVTAVLCIGVAVVAVGALPFDKLNGAQAPLATALDEGAGFGWASNIISFGALVAITSVVLTILYGQTRIFFAMCRDGLMPVRWAYVHPK